MATGQIGLRMDRSKNTAIHTLAAPHPDPLASTRVSQTDATCHADTLVLGAGPAGLACADRLAAGGQRPLVIEGAAEPGGLMRGIRHGAFQLDLGRKELYSRLPEVHEYWRELLGDDFERYEHRIGILYRGRILEVSDGPRGRRRGMPWSWLLAGGLQLLAGRLRRHRSAPRTYEQYWHRERGERFARMLSQGFEEKFRGVRWADLPPPDLPAPPPEFADDAPLGWWHPRLGTGQIIDAMQQRIASNGGRVACAQRVLAFDIDDNRITAVRTTSANGPAEHRPRFVVSSLPLEALGSLLGLPAAKREPGAAVAARRGAALVYLFVDEPPRFPHAWLNVTCPDLRIGRIVNYANFGSGMVPSGASCLGVEFFYVTPDPLANASDAEVAALAQQECESAGLIRPGLCREPIVIQLPGGDPATTASDWQDTARQRILAASQRCTNLFDIKRPGTDKATQAGLDAAAEILGRSDD